MPDKTPAEKLRLKPGMTAALLNVPNGVELGVPEGVTVSGDPTDADFILEFATTQAEAESRSRALAPFIGEKTILWFGYPKDSKAKGYDLNRDTIAAFVRAVGLIVNANFSIDDRWSAVRARPIKPGG